MKTIIAGSRGITSIKHIVDAVERSGFTVSHIISGGAAGVDQLGEAYAKRHQIPLTIMKANWKTHGRSAGYKRNTQMAEVADALIAVWDGKSNGTKHMIDTAKRLKLSVYIYTPFGTPVVYDELF